MGCKYCKQSDDEQPTDKSLRTNLHPKSAAPPANFAVNNAVATPGAQYTSYNITLKPTHLKQDCASPKPANFAATQTKVHHVPDINDLKSQLAGAGAKLVVIDFFATWCGPCKMISPQVEKMDEEMDDVVFLKVDVDEAEDVAEEYDVQAMPTFVLIKNGKKVNEMRGANAGKLRQLISQHK